MDKYEVLKRCFGHDSFRGGQEPLVDALISGRDVLGVMPTGAGKSVCYQIPAIMSDGITLVVSPLISLMKDQVAALKQAGVRAAYLNSSLTPGQCRTVLERAAGLAYQIMYVAPERLVTPGFLRFAGSVRISALIVDEAHCISQWGQDFRPSYLKIREFIERLPLRPVVGAFTATATDVVRKDIAAALELRDPLCIVTGFDRPNLYFGVYALSDKFAAMLSYVSEKSECSGIIYCSTRKNVEEVCAYLNAHDISAVRYHAGLADEERRSSQEDFQFDRCRVMVATNAFGMGIDKSNVSFVIHFNMPKDLESYYQEAGRAGRDGEKAECILLYSKQDVVTAKWLINHGRTNPDISEEQRALLLERDLERLKQMTFYATTGRCLRGFILRYFGESPRGDCNNCSNCCKPHVEAPAPDSFIFDRRRAKKAEDDPATERLLAALKELRLAIARERGIPAYAVFSNATLRDMARKKPKDKDHLSQVSGVGERKLAQYGDAFLRCIRKAAAHGAQTSSKKPPRAAAGGDEAAAAYMPWTEEEEDCLQSEFEEGMSISAIAREHGRSNGAIRSRLIKLGLIDQD